MNSSSQRNPSGPLSFDDWMHSYDNKDAKFLQKLLNEVQIGKKLYNWISGLEGPLHWEIWNPKAWKAENLVYIRALCDCQEIELLVVETEDGKARLKWQSSSGGESVISELSGWSESSIIERELLQQKKTD